ncbi:hypothetical protein TSTA_126710, partial [Talaromyces stipitatus ATCC 10500]
QYIILDRQGREHKVTNPIFMEDEYGFLSRKPGERGEIERSRQKPSTIGQSIEPILGFQHDKGAEIPIQVDIKNKTSHDRVRRPTQAALESAATETIYRRKSRQERRQEAREASKDTASRISLAREACLKEVANPAVVIELLLGDDDEFAYKAAKIGGEIPIPQ